MLEDELRQETQKWLNKIIAERKKVVLLDEKRKGMIKNIDAYISDSKHFLEGNDLIRAYEAVIWAWAWIEILKELNIIEYHNIGQGLIVRRK